jgi:hypothetical protein
MFVGNRNSAELHLGGGGIRFYLNSGASPMWLWGNAGTLVPLNSNVYDLGGSSQLIRNIYIGGFLRTVPVAYSSLPSAATAGVGARAAVTDATSCSFASAVTGGGSTFCPVVSDGTNWNGG